MRHDVFRSEMYIMSNDDIQVTAMNHGIVGDDLRRPGRMILVEKSRVSYPVRFFVTPVIHSRFLEYSCLLN